MSVSIIIINYNQKNLLKVCLKGILRVAPKIDYEIIIVDNCSNLKQQEEIKKLIFLDKNRIKIFFNQKNIGFGAGCNVGIKKSKGDYILILNPDIAILENSIESLVKFMEENKKIGIVGPKLLNPNKTIQKSCFRFPLWYIPILRRTFLGKLSWAKKELSSYLMSDFDHQEITKVNWI
jgi:GT2 family glycosyltransferase